MSMNISGLGNTYNGINTNSKQYKALKEKGWLSGIMQNEAMMSSEERMIYETCLLYTSPSPRDGLLSRMPSSA